MKIVLLDADTLGDVKSIDRLKLMGEFYSYSTTSADELNERVKDAEIIITNKVIINYDTIVNSPSLKLICVAATGMNNIDLEAAKNNNVLVKNVSGYSTESVAQQTFAMLLSITNHVHYFVNHVQRLAYSKGKIFTLVDNPIYELKGKVLGIIGLGDIGRRVAEIASVFGLKVVYYSTSGIDRSATYERVDLNELLEISDIISIHAPLNDKTNNLININTLSRMKSSVILLNNGRGGIVNEQDLVQALNENIILAAGLDVFTEEPLSIDSQLLKFKNSERLLLFPHIAWSSVEARESLINGVIANIEHYQKQKVNNI